jgi:drug/metabolite transporter (DMT)-like permease
MTLHLGILFALLCAFVTNLAFLYKHRGACEAPQVDIRHPLQSAAGLWRSRWFAIGMVVGLGAWLFHVAALAMAPLSVVQVVLASGLVLLAVMADRLFGFEIGRRQWLGLGAMAIGLGLIAITQPSSEGSHSSYSLLALTAFEGGLLAIGALLIAGPRVVGAPKKHHGVALAAAAGILFGVCNVAIKALTGVVGIDGVVGLVSPWLLVAALGSAAAFYASARSLQDGEAVEVIAITGTAANISCIAGGIVVFGDPLPNDALGIVLQSVAFVLVIVAAALTPAPVRAARVAHAPA